MQTLMQDIRFGVRMLIKNPLVTFVAVVTLALGIGANTAIFSAVNGLLLRPLPVPNADRLTVIAGQVKGIDVGSPLSYLEYRDLREQTQGFSDILGYDLNGVGMQVDGGDAQALLIGYVTGNYFTGLGLQPAYGRLFSGESVEKPGNEPELVLGYGFWKKHFNSDPSVVGKQVKLNGRAATIVGVAPEGFRGTYSLVDMQAYLPLGSWKLFLPNDDAFTKRDSRRLRVIGVLAPGVDRKAAQSSVDLVIRRMAQTYPEDKDLTAHVYPEWLARPEPDPTNGTVIAGLTFMAMAGLVLLVACTNVANIVLVRATGRAREMAVRAALGASRFRLSRQLLTESIILGLAGGVAGLVLGSWISRLLSSIDLEAFGNRLVFDFGFDWRVFAFALTAAVLTGLLVGLWPAFRISRSDLNQVLHEGSRGILAGTGRSIARSVLVVVQVAVSLTLLVVAGLFVRSTRNAEHAYFGFEPTHVLNLIMDPHNVGFDEQRTRQFYRDLEDRIKELPGVENVSLAAGIPMGYSLSFRPVYVAGKTAVNKESAPTIFCNYVSTDYFATMRIPMLRGRVFNKQDTDKSPLVAIVNEAMAKRFWPNEDPIGKTFRIKTMDGPQLEIVGLARQGKYTSPTDDNFPFFYVPNTQQPISMQALQIRTAQAPEALIPDAERMIHELAPGLPLVGVESMQHSLEGANGLFLFRLGTRFAGALGLLGLILALVGVYGVVSYVAAQRTHEIGVRMALGADRVHILKMVLRQGFILVGMGVAVGLVITFGATRLIANLLLGVSPSDPLTFAAVTVFLALVGLLASLIPARRAMNVEPLRALKYE